MERITEKYIKSPLNYTGNKYRILSQIEKYFPEKINKMIDLFCGGATVGINCDVKKTIFVDNNEKVLNLLKFLAEQNFLNFINECESIIQNYSLSYSYKNGYKIYRQQCLNQKDNNGLKDYNHDGFYKLRNDYNSLADKNTDSANVMLYMLMVYGFNNDIRFNSNGNFNLPVGKTDLNKNNVIKIKEYIEKAQQKNISFKCCSFTDKSFSKLLKDVDFVYMDPPYLIGDAVYNSTWDLEMENSLLSFIDSLIERKINFALSNVIRKVGVENEPLVKWCKLNDTKIRIEQIDYHYRSASYHKKARNAHEEEVLIFNKRYSNENQ
ncbi:Dam family site-specific DNA-(adenine-N6)-methyltransferase [Treponema sp.]|uniref:Dam family site-specific DNA-(adenine-N6)-methyltransferase n=1 Tax=Treponema sp. TaxID=166 RepID=UPI003FD81ACF